MDYNNNQLFMEAIFEITTPSHIVYAMYHKDDDITEDIVIKKTNRAGKHKPHNRSNMVKDKAKHGYHTPRKWDTDKAYNQQSLTAARKRSMHYDDVFDDITMEEARECAIVETAEEEADRIMDELHYEVEEYNFYMEDIEDLKVAIEDLKLAISRDWARLKKLNAIIRSIRG